MHGEKELRLKRASARRRESGGKRTMAVGEAWNVGRWLWPPRREDSAQQMVEESKSFCELASAVQWREFLSSHLVQVPSWPSLGWMRVICGELGGPGVALPVILLEPLELSLKSPRVFERYHEF